MDPGTHKRPRKSLVRIGGGVIMTYKDRSTHYKPYHDQMYGDLTNDNFWINGNIVRKIMECRDITPIEKCVLTMMFEYFDATSVETLELSIDLGISIDEASTALFQLEQKEYVIRDYGMLPGDQHPQIFIYPGKKFDAFFE